MATVKCELELDEELVNQATKIYKDLELDLNAVIRLFLAQSVRVGGIPFDLTLKKPNPEYKAYEAVEALIALNEEAVRAGISDMTLDEINAEIDAIRKERRLRRQKELEAEQ